jgi:hypothetical protein
MSSREIEPIIHSIDDTFSATFLLPSPLFIPDKLQLLCAKQVVNLIVDNIRLSGGVSCSDEIHQVFDQLPSIAIELFISYSARNNLLKKSSLNYLINLGLNRLDFSHSNLVDVDPHIFTEIWSIENSNITAIDLSYSSFPITVFSIFSTPSIYPNFSVENLTSLNLCNSEITDGIVELACKQFHSLKSINLSHCKNITSSSVYSISDGAFKSSLVELDLSYNSLTETALCTLTSLSSLQVLTFSGIKNHYSSSHLQQPNSGISNCRFSFQNLSVLNISGWSHISSEDIAFLLWSNKHSLVQLEIAESAITSSDLNNLVLFDALPFPRLKYLDISWCDELSSQAISLIFSSAPLLRRVLLRAAAADSETVDNISSNCTELVYANFSRCKDLSNECITNMALKLPYLIFIDISWSMLEDSGTSIPYIF